MKTRTHNERFGASGAVPRPKGSADFEVMCLVSSAVEAPPAAKPLGRCVQAEGTDSTVNNRLIEI